MVTQKHPIYQNNEQTSLKNKEVEPVEPLQMNIYQSNTYRKDLNVVSAIFYQIFVFSQNDSPLKTTKNVFYFI